MRCACSRGGGVLILLVIWMAKICEGRKRCDLGRGFLCETATLLDAITRISLFTGSDPLVRNVESITLSYSLLNSPFCRLL